MHPSPLLLSACLAASTAAQTCIYTGPADPANGSGSPVPLLSGFSPGTPTVGMWRRQLVIPAFLFQNVPTRITELSLGVRVGYVRLQITHLTVRMGQTTRTPLSTTFDQNITSSLQDVQVISDHLLLEGAGPAWVPLGLQEPYLFLPGHGDLLIEVVQEWTTVLDQLPNTFFADAQLGAMLYSGYEDPPPTVGTMTGQANTPRVRLCVDRAELSLFGTSCGGIANQPPLLGLQGAPSLGSQTTFWLSNVPASTFALLAFGFDNQPPFPLDLGTQGAAGCNQYFPIAFTTAVIADPLGLGQYVVTIPNNVGLLGTIVLGQYVALEPGSNTLGVLTSNYGRVLVGR